MKKIQVCKIHYLSPWVSVSSGLPLTGIAVDNGSSSFKLFSNVPSFNSFMYFSCFSDKLSKSPRSLASEYRFAFLILIRQFCIFFKIFPPQDVQHFSRLERDLRIFCHETIRTYHTYRRPRRRECCPRFHLLQIQI